MRCFPRIGENKMYVVKDIAALVNRVQTGQWFAYGKHLDLPISWKPLMWCRPLMEYFMRQFEDSDAWYNFTSSREYFLRHETLTFMDVVRTTGIYLAPYTKSSKLCILGRRTLSEISADFIRRRWN